MTYPPWQRTREQASYYPRSPEQTALYRLVYYFREEFEQKWDELFAERFGALRAEVLEAFDRYLNCGILRYGCVRACCEQCNHSVLIAFSCKRRGVCPSCQAKRAVIFAENLEQNVLLPHAHRHLVYSIPKRLRVYFRFDRRLLSLLYRAAWESWSEYVEALIPGGKSGAVMALHTAGSLLEWNPHLHTLALDGAVLDDGHFVPLPEIDSELVQEFFAEKVFIFLLAEELIDEETVKSMRGWKNSGFSFYASERIPEEDTERKLFVARYLKKAPVSLARLSIDESGRELFVKYAKLNDEERAGKRQAEFSPLEFLAQLSLHVPRVLEQTTRYLGVYSPRTRGAKRRAERFRKLVENNFEPLSYKEPPKAASISWARCMKLVFELEPLQCPKCGGEMKIKAFITDVHEIERIASHLGRYTWRAPPAFKKAPDTIWLDCSAEFSQIH